MQEIKELVEAYFKAWNKAFVSKNGDEIRKFMSEKFVGYWAHSQLEKPDQYGFNYDLNEVLKQYGSAEKHFEVLSVLERKNEYVIQGRETNVINGTPHYAQCMFIWRRENKKWKLLREYIELER